ncbi:MAG: hypothetical protein QXS68_06280 [Candidatus Methanomethylicaceae archaeon]
MRNVYSPDLVTDFLRYGVTLVSDSQFKLGRTLVECNLTDSPKDFVRVNEFIIPRTHNQSLTTIASYILSFAKVMNANERDMIKYFRLIVGWVGTQPRRRALEQSVVTDNIIRIGHPNIQIITQLCVSPQGEPYLLFKKTRIGVKMHSEINEVMTLASQNYIL